MTGARPRVAGLLPMRVSSTRCVRKMVRPFGDTTLATLALEKVGRSRALDALYVAVHEDELIEAAGRFPAVRLIRRSRQSAFGEDMRSIYDFMDQIAEPVIAVINACCPFTKPETIDAAVEEFLASGAHSMLPVFETKEWYFDASGHCLNKPDPSVMNSKTLPPVYRAAHPFTLFWKERFLAEYKVWSLEPGDPKLFVIAEDESLDIDTEHQFEMAEALYRQRRLQIR